MRRLFPSFLLAAFLLAAGCGGSGQVSPGTPGDNRSNAQAAIEEWNEADNQVGNWISLDGPRRPPAQVAELERAAQRGDVQAMLTLAAHHFAADGPEGAARGQRWLREAGAAGDCRALLLLEDPVFNTGMAATEVSHWRSESRRFRCSDSSRPQ